MKEKNNGITLISIIFIIIAIILAILLLFSSYWFQNLCTKVSIIYQAVTNQINIEEELTENEKMLGVTDVTGEGIVIHILDGNDLIHQEDLIILIDELKNSGSQAISINEQRITNSTYLYCDGAVILIDGVKIGNPFQMKAIGNAETLYGALTRNKGYLETLKKDGIEISVEKQEKIDIPKTKKEKLYEYQNNNKIEKLFLTNQMTGKSRMLGKGLQIVIEENSAKLTALSFLQIINDLNSASVDAISINGQRITNMTDIMDISDTYVLVNSIPIKAPYIIDVIGNQDKIEEVLAYDNSYISKIENSGNHVNIFHVHRLTIEEYIQKKDQNKMLVDYLNNKE